MPEQPAFDADGHALAIALRDERCQKIEHDVIVIAGVERHPPLSARRDDAADDIERAVAIERCDLDRNHLLDFGEPAPELPRELDTTNRRLKVEPHERYRQRHRAAVRNQLVFVRALHRAEG